MNTRKILSTVGFALLFAAIAAVLGTLVVRDQIQRSRRNLFSPHALRRLAALRYLGRVPASVDAVLLLRDFIAWERRPMLRRRASALLARMEDGLDISPGVSGQPEVA
jgi:hypothetical protein